MKPSLIALRSALSAVDPGLQRPHLAVEREQGIEIERDILVGDRLADVVRILADERQAQHQRGLAGNGDYANRRVSLERHPPKIEAVLADFPWRSSRSSRKRRDE